MRIPADLNEREALYAELVNSCLMSRQDRISYYERLRAYYLWGSQSADTPATYNKILPQMELLVSFLFAAETTRFSVVVGESEDAHKHIDKVGTLSTAVNARWMDSNADVQFGEAVTWALVYNSMFIKLIQRGRNTYPYLVDPHSMGVLREDMPFLDDQEAFVHVYSITAKALERLLKSHPKASTLIPLFTATLKQEAHDIPSGLGRIIMSTMPMLGAPSGPGQVMTPMSLLDTYRARMTEPTVEMHELWVWDDEKNEYRVNTRAAGNISIYDRENFYLPGEHPFVQVAPNPSYDYFWGHSEVARLIGLQDALEIRMQQVSELLSRQIKPPVTLRGNWQGIPDETIAAMNVFGGGANTSDPTADAKVWAPTIPTDVYAEVRAIEEMFNEITGLQNVIQGKGEAGVRSKGQTSELARLGSARIRKRAFTIEDALDKMGTHFLKLMQVYDKTNYVDAKQNKFIAEQFTKDFSVKVDAHSSSPIFTEDMKQLAFKLFEAKAIDRAELLKLVDPVMKQQLLEGLKRIEAAEKAAAEAEKKAEAAQAGLKAVK